MRRFLHPDLPAEGAFELTGDEAHHLGRVLRAAPGDTVTVLDGTGREVVARVDDVGRKRVRLTIVSESDPPRAARRVTVWTALPRGDRLEWLVEKTTECGVASVLPTVFTRSARRALPDNAQRRLRRAAAEAAKQCGRADVPSVDVPRGLADRLAELPAGVLVVLAPDAAVTIEERVRAADPAAEVLLVVGPEGGLTDDERASLAAAGALEAALGPFVLRIETAAVVAVHAALAGGNGGTS